MLRAADRTVCAMLVHRGLLQEGCTLSRGSDEAGVDRAVKTEEDYRRFFTEINGIITDRLESAIGDRIVLRDAVCAYLEVEQVRGTTLTRLTQIVEEILRKTELPGSRLGDSSASRNTDLAQELVAWCVESQGASGKLAN